jgi:hypothetical protein
MTGVQAMSRSPAPQSRQAMKADRTAGTRDLNGGAKMLIVETPYMKA